MNSEATLTINLDRHSRPEIAENRGMWMTETCMIRVRTKDANLRTERCRNTIMPIPFCAVVHNLKNMQPFNPLSAQRFD